MQFFRFLRKAKKLIKLSIPPIIKMDPSILEEEKVKQVYDIIASHFSDTRYNVWPAVASFLDTLEPQSNILDCGCGNGKNMLYRTDCTNVGIDNSVGLLEISKGKGLDVIEGDIRNLPYSDNSFDAAISVAVIHHLATPEDRLIAIQEMIRVVKPGGKIYIQVWDINVAADKPHKFIPINQDGDYIVNWNNKQDGKIYERYYHLYTETEFTQIFEKYDGEISNDHNNWIINFIVNKPKD